MESASVVLREGEPPLAAQPDYVRGPSSAGVDYARGPGFAGSDYGIESVERVPDSVRDPSTRETPDSVRGRERVYLTAIMAIMAIMSIMAIMTIMAIMALRPIWPLWPF